jgi:hypothetical protein
MDAAVEPPVNAANEGNGAVSGIMMASQTRSETTALDALASKDDLCDLEKFKKALERLVDAAPASSTTDDPVAGKQRSSLLAPMEDKSCDGLIAKYVSLWSVLERPEAQRFSAQARIGLKMLELKNFDAADKVFKEIEFQTSTPAALSYVMGGIGRFLTFFGMAVFAIMTVAILFFINSKLILGNEQFSQLVVAVEKLDPRAANVVVASIAGMFGSVVSLLLRIGEFEATKGRSQMFLRLTGATLPVIGGMFGAFVASLISSELINIPAGNLNLWTFVVIGFLSGFSERFSRGFLQIAEKRLGGGEAPTISVSTERTVLAGSKTIEPGVGTGGQLAMR